MKKSLSIFVGLLVALGAISADAATNWGTRAGSSADLSSAPATRTREKINYEKYQTRTLTKTYESKDAGDLYYSQPQNRSALYKQYEGANSSSARATKTTQRTTRSEKIVNKMRRKYFLAHPFYQPLGGKFGSHTDLSYNNVGYDVVLPNGSTGVFDGTGAELRFNGVGGEWNMTGFSIKEDFSYGITDRIAVLAMAQYDISDYKYKWGDGSPDDKMENDGFNVYGLGAQWRFVDTDKWIAMASAHFQHQKDIANNYRFELKGGYKVSSSTIYGLVRGWYVDFKNEIYGDMHTGKDAAGHDTVLLMVYDDTGSGMYFEGGMGVFSVLNEDWTLNAEAIFGHYDWHNQGDIRAAIGWQPNDWFALNLYAKIAIWDSMDGKKLDTYYWRSGTYLDAGGTKPLNELKYIGTTETDNYAETKIGLQVMFQF